MRLFRYAGLVIVTAGLMLAIARPSLAATTKITIDPTAASVPSGHTVSFVVKAVDANGSSTDVTGQTVFSTNDPKGTLTGATYMAGQAGSWTIQAAYQSFVTTAAVTVTPGSIAEIEINPNSDPEIIFTGTSKKFTARAFDARSNEIPGVNFVWSVAGSNGTVSSSGVFAATTVGTGKIQAQANGVTGQVSVDVEPAPVATTNTSTTNANTNTHLTTNTNSSVNQNTNAAAVNSNANTNSVSNTNTTAAPVTTTTPCTSLKPWVWTLILIIFLIAVAVLYGFVPVTKIWPVIIALVGAGVLAYVQRKYDCSLQTWWAWVVTLGTIALTALAIRSKPMMTKTSA